MKELFLISALAMPPASFQDPHVRVYKMLLDHMSANLIDPKRSLVVGNSPRMVHDMREAGMEAYGLSPNPVSRNYVQGLESVMPIKAGTISLLVHLRTLPDDPWLAMRVFQNVIGLIQPWGFFIAYDEDRYFSEWLPRFGFSLLPFMFSDNMRIWQRHKHDDHGQVHNGKYGRSA